jgi:hypothetical protein
MSEMGAANDAYDFLTQIEDELAVAREAAKEAVDRADAFAELRSYTLEVEEELGRPVRALDVFDTNDETRRARLSALADRITREVN